MNGSLKISFNKIIKELSELDLKDYGKDFLRTWDKDENSIRGTLLSAQLLRNLYYSNISPKVFNSGIAISIFRDKSTRTRYSFASGSNLLGLTVQDLDEEKSQITHGETVMETANMISFLTRAIGIRDDIYLGLGHSYMREVSNSVDKGYREGVLAQRPAIVNLQCDEDHPTQSLSDLLHLINYFGGIGKLRGKKLVMSWAYSPSYGKPLSVPQGVIALMSRFGMKISLAYPNGYNLIPQIEQLAKKEAQENGGSFEIVNDMKKAFVNADIVYPKSWAPYKIMKQRTKLLKSNDTKGLENLEKEGLANNAKYKDWTCTEELMKVTKKGSALYMHCLPADITGVSCKEGEVETDVFEKYRKQTYLEASYKPFVIASMILLAQYGNKTSKVIKEIMTRGKKIAFF